MKQEVELAFVGDCAPSREYAQQPHLISRAFEDIRKHLADNAVLFLNLECAVTDETTDSEPTVCNRRILSVLEAAKPAVVNLANNHFFDAGFEMCDRVRQTLADIGIPSVGIYTTDRPPEDVVTINGWKVGVLSRLARGTHPSSWGHSNHRIVELQAATLIRDCRTIRPNVDLLILSLHWGAEYYTVPSPWQRRLAADLLGAGVDIIWGHHAHVLQPRILVGRQLVMYNLGNFIFGSLYPGRWSEQSRTSVVTRVRRTDAETTCKEFPIHIDRDGALRLVAKEQPIRQAIRLRRRIGVFDRVNWLRRRLYTEIVEIGFRHITVAQARRSTESGRFRRNPARLLFSFARRLARAVRLRADE